MLQAWTVYGGFLSIRGYIARHLRVELIARQINISQKHFTQLNLCFYNMIWGSIGVFIRGFLGRQPVYRQ